MKLIDLKNIIKNELIKTKEISIGLIGTFIFMCMMIFIMCGSILVGILMGIATIGVVISSGLSLVAHYIFKVLNPLTYIRRIRK